MRLAVRCKPPLFNTENHAKKTQMPISDVIVSLFGSFHLIIFSPCTEFIWATFQHASPGIYMCVVSANITCLPSNLYPSHSYYQHGHCGISETLGVVDGGRLSYFPMHRVHLGLLPTRPSPVTYIYVVSAKVPCLPSKLSSAQSYCQHGH